MPADYASARRRLIIRYAIFSSSLLIAYAASVYLYVRNTSQAVEQAQVMQLAADSASQLPLLRHELEEANGQPAEISQAKVVADLANRNTIHLDGKQIRWFNADLKEITRYGNFSINGGTIPPLKNLQSSQLQVFDVGLLIWRPVYVHRGIHQPPRLEGYVSVSLSSEPAHKELTRLRNGLLIGATLAAILAAVVSQWMVASSLNPIREHIHRLHQFTADASHELRNPLTAIRSVFGSIFYSQERDAISPLLIHKLCLIDQAVAQMAQLIDDLLMLARLDKNFADKSAWIAFNLEDLVEDIVNLYQGMAQDHQVQLLVLAAGFVHLRAHPGRLKQLIVNLVVNAIRFSPRGGTVTVGLHCNGRWAELWVDDQGPGIPEQEREQVFERFWQGDKARSQAGNFGLGLAMAKAITESHGGQIMALAAPMTGCRMLLRLPLLEPKGLPDLLAMRPVHAFSPINRR